jgi:hypothetical protein
LFNPARIAASLRLPDFPESQDPKNPSNPAMNSSFVTDPF